MLNNNFLCNWCEGTEWNNPDNVPEDKWPLAQFGLVELSTIECASCGSKPRQRCLKQTLDQNRTTEWQQYKTLQLSPDLLPIISHWFNEFEVSEYNGENSIDLEDANRLDNTYDLISCIHILEHIKNDTVAIEELIRILKPGGQVYIMVPQPALPSNAITRDWGYPDENDYGHYRIYGRDFKDKLISITKATAKLDVFEKIDSFTSKKELIYVLTKNVLTSTSDTV